VRKTIVEVGWPGVMFEVDQTQRDRGLAYQKLRCNHECLNIQNKSARYTPQDMSLTTWHCQERPLGELPREACWTTQTP
jgi:hypothetical protein